jgi:uncharacterized protein (DUF305 family)
MLGRTPPRRFVLAVAAAVVLAFGSAACGDKSDGDSGASGAQTAANGDVFNDADVEFAVAMIPHHAQAIQMVTLTDTRTLDPEVRQLAERIRAAQSPQVETMVDWLTAWGEEVPETSMDHSHGDHEPGEMPEGMDDLPGMMSPDEMQALADAADGEFQVLWLEMMVEHHAGAIEMALTEIDKGRHPDALSMAESIAASQQAEIDEIGQLLGS